MLGSLLCLPGSGSVLLDPCTGSTISETTSEAWSVEVLPSDSGQDPQITARPRASVCLTDKPTAARKPDAGRISRDLRIGRALECFAFFEND